MQKEIKIHRPQSIDDFIGQKNIKENLQTYVSSAKIQKKTLPHIILSGAPGLGKTSCAFLSSQLMNCNLKSVNGVSLQKANDITSLLVSLQKGEILFIDEIHRMNKKIEEILYSPMEDFFLDLIMGEGTKAKTIRVNLPEFTLIGATTKYGILSQPLRNRFGIHFRFQEYSFEDISIIIENFAIKNNLSLDKESAYEIAYRSKKTPRIALNLFKRIVDFMYANKENILSKDLILFATEKMGIDKGGLEELDRNYLRILNSKHPIGLNTIAGLLNENNITIEETIEPYLLNINFIEKTSKGRLITEKGLFHLNSLKNF